MPTFIQHENINIVTLYRDDAIAEHCQPGDIALKQEGDGWMTYVIRENGQVDRHGPANASYDEALASARKAAENGLTSAAPHKQG